MRKPCKTRKLSVEQAKELRTLRQRERITFRALGERFGISGPAAYYIYRGHNRNGKLYAEPQAQPDLVEEVK